MTRRDQVGQVLGSNPLLAAWVITFLLGLAAFGWQSLHAADGSGDQDLQAPCPPGCRSITYNSWQWYAECWGFPRKCSANPEEETLAMQVLSILVTVRIW